MNRCYLTYKDHNYAAYAIQRDHIRAKYPKNMSREEWKRLFAEIMDLIESSEDWQRWIWENPMPLDMETRGRRCIDREDRRKKRQYSKKDPYPQFVLFINGVRTDREWNHLRNAERELGLSKGTICAILHGHRRVTMQGYSFKYVRDLEE